MQAGAGHVVVVGPDRPELVKELMSAAGVEAGAGVAVIEFASEMPPGAGPVPALRAGLDRIAEPRLLLLAADLPFLTGAALRDLVAAAGPGLGAVVADQQDQPQWLVSCWCTIDLRGALDGYAGRSLRGLLAPLPHVDLAAVAQPGEPPYWLDCDTPEDLAIAERLGRQPISKDLISKDPISKEQR